MPKHGISFVIYQLMALLDNPKERREKHGKSKSLGATC